MGFRQRSQSFPNSPVRDGEGEFRSDSLAVDIVTSGGQLYF